jgi:hypothetical protein
MSMQHLRNLPRSQISNGQMLGQINERLRFTWCCQAVRRLKLMPLDQEQINGSWKDQRRRSNRHPVPCLYSGSVILLSSPPSVHRKPHDPALLLSPADLAHVPSQRQATDGSAGRNLRQNVTQKLKSSRDRVGTVSQPHLLAAGRSSRSREAGPRRHHSP